MCSKTTSGWWSPCQPAQSHSILLGHPILDMRPQEDKGLLASYLRVGHDLVAPGGAQKCNNYIPTSTALSSALENFLTSSPWRKGATQPPVIQLILFILKANAGVEQVEN